jgi:hypothetical protein
MIHTVCLSSALNRYGRSRVHGGQAQRHVHDIPTYAEPTFRRSIWVDGWNTDCPGNQADTLHHRTTAHQQANPLKHLKPSLAP